VALATTAAAVVVGFNRPREPLKRPWETVSERTLKAPTVSAPPSVLVATGADVTRVGSTEVADASSRMFEMARVVGRMVVTLATMFVTLETTSVTLATALETIAVGVSVTAGTLTVTAGTLTVTVPGRTEEVAGRSERTLGMMLSTVGTTDWMVTGIVTLGRTEVRPVT